MSLLVVLACICALGIAVDTRSDGLRTPFDDVDDKVEASIEHREAQLAQDLLIMGSMISSDPHESPRHRHEKAHLMKRMDPIHGKWSSTHPRYRLLEALFGFMKYRERNMAELDRWRKLYKNVGKQQKKVR